MKGLNFWHLQSNYLLAVQSGDVDRCKALLAGGVDADQVFKINSQTIPAICIGVERGAYSLVELLLRSGVAVNSRDSRGRTSLHVAIEMGYEAICNLLLAHRADPNASDNQLLSPLHLAAKRGSPALISSLISFGADVNRKDSSGKTPLFCACSNPIENLDAIRILIDSGANPNDLDISGYSPLLCALLTFKFDVASLLISHGANCDITTGDGNSPIHVVILSNNPQKWEVLSLLLRKGVSPNLTNDMGQTPVHLGCLRQDIDSLRILIASGANPNSVDRLGLSPLGYCISNGMEKFANLLIAGGAWEDLEKLKISKITQKFKENLRKTLKNPKSLGQLSRLCLAKHLGPEFIPWGEENKDFIPRNLHKFIQFKEI